MSDLLQMENSENYKLEKSVPGLTNLSASAPAALSPLSFSPVLQDSAKVHLKETIHRKSEETFK